MHSMSGDSGATQQPEFNKYAADYKANYNNPPTSGEIQDQLRRSGKHETLKSKKF